MEYEMLIAFAMVSFFVSLCGIYIGTKLSWREGRKSTETMLDKLLKSEQAAQISELLKQINDFSHSPEGKQLISNIQELLKDLRAVSKQLLGEGITITPSKSKEPLINLPPKPETDDTEKLRVE